MKQVIFNRYLNSENYSTSMKKNLMKFLRFLLRINTLFWSGLDLRKAEEKQNSCIAYREGWCHAGWCDRCAGMTPAEAEITRSHLQAMRAALREQRNLSEKPEGYVPDVEPSVVCN